MRGGLTGLTGPGAKSICSTRNLQLSASAVGSTHRIVRRPVEGSPFQARLGLLSAQRYGLQVGEAADRDQLNVAR